MSAIGAVIGVSGLLVAVGAYLLIPSYFSQHAIGVVCGAMLSVTGLATALSGAMRQPSRFVAFIASAVAVADIALLIWTGVFVQLWVQGAGRIPS
jgi:hypothetical protein